MGSSVNIVAHNLQAMFSERQLGIVTDKKAKSTEKLSSGYRINRSADDAAGLAISEKMRRQVRGLTQGTRNAQDGISMCQIADGALAEVHEMLGRITTLSVQSANETNNAEDRQAIQQEISLLLKEIDRVCDTTTFNEQPIFQGAEGVTVIPATYEPTTVDNFTATGTPIGTKAGTYTISASSAGFSIGGGNHSWSEFKDSSGHTLADSAISAGTYSFTHNGIKMSVDAQSGASREDIVGKLNGAGYSTKIASSTRAKLSDMIEISIGSNGSIGGMGYASNRTPRFSVNNTAGYPQITFHSGLANYDGSELTATSKIYLQNSGGVLADLDTDIEDFFTVCDFTVDKTWAGNCGSAGPMNVGTVEDHTAGEPLGALYVTPCEKYSNLEYKLSDFLYLIDGCEVSTSVINDTIFDDGTIGRSFSGTSWRDTASGKEIVIKNDRTIDTDVTLSLDRVFSPDYRGREITPEERITADSDKTIYIQSGVEAGDGIYLTFGRMDTNILGINGLDVSTGSGASNAIDRSKKAIGTLNKIRSDIGAQQNRLEHTIKHQNNTIENTQRAESQIRDTDMATEMMAYSALDIIQQSGQTVLAQANQSHQGVLSLLQ